MIFHARITIYQGDKFIVTTEVKHPSGVWVTHAVSNPMLSGGSDFDLGQECLASLQSSEYTHYNDDSFEFWKALGYKTYSAFSKKHNCIGMSKSDKVFRLILWQRSQRGSYTPSKDPNHTIDLPLDASPVELAQAVRTLFAYVTPKSEEVLTIETVNDNLFTYSLPAGSDFEDLGDGHTDAYQIFASVDDSDSYIAFMIDSGYSSFSEVDMKKGFEKHYGPLLEYDYKLCRGKTFKFKVTGKTDSLEIVSYLFPDGDDWLEVIYVLDQRISKCKITQLRKVFNTIIKSVQIKSTLV